MSKVIKLVQHAPSALLPKSVRPIHQSDENLGYSANYRVRYGVYVGPYASRYQCAAIQIQFGERAFSHSGPQAWNELPLSLRDDASLSAFKNT